MYVIQLTLYWCSFQLQVAVLLCNDQHWPVSTTLPEVQLNMGILRRPELLLPNCVDLLHVDSRVSHATIEMLQSS